MEPQTSPVQTENTPNTALSQRSTNPLLIGILLLIAFGVGFATSHFVKEKEIAKKEELAPITQSDTIQTTSIETFEDKTPSEWKKYDEAPGVTFYYPPTWTPDFGIKASPEVISYVGFLMNPSDHVYTGTSAKPYQRSISLYIYPLNNFKAIQDDSSFFVYDNTKKEMLHVTCKDYSSTTGCDKAKDIATTTLAKNIKIGGKEGYLFLDDSRYFVPINDSIGASILVTPYAEDLDEISRQLLGSFRFE